MIYLIDGYNVLFQAAEEIGSLEEERAYILPLIERFFVSINKKAIIVFDAKSDTGSQIPSKKFTTCLEVVFSPSDQTADAYIIEYMNRHPHASITVVSSDKEVIFHAKKNNNQTLSSKKFIKKITTHSCHKIEKPETTTPEETARLLKKWKSI